MSLIKNKTILSKQLILNVFTEVAKCKRTETKVVAKNLKTDITTASKALNILSKYKIIKSRKYSDIGVTYYYPSDAHVFSVFVFSPTRSFVAVCDSAMNVRDTLWVANCSFHTSEESLKWFLKNSNLFLSEIYNELPGKTPYVFLPGEFIDQNNSTVSSDVIPTLHFLDVKKIVCDTLKVERCRLLTYKYEKGLNAQNEDFISQIVKMCISTHLKKKVNKNSQH